MDMKGRLITGSHNRNEFILIDANEITSRVTSVKEFNKQTCEICSDDIEISAISREPFVACNECGFPVCRPCYVYERREGNQACPKCKTRYKHIKGTPRVEGDKEEDDIDDLDNEFHIGSKEDNHDIANAVLTDRLNAQHGTSQVNSSEITIASDRDSASVSSEIPILIYGQEDESHYSDTIATTWSGHRGKHAHKLPFSDTTKNWLPRPMDPKKDQEVYGYGSITWKDRIDKHKKKQNEKLQVAVKDNEDGDGQSDHIPRLLPKMDEGRQPLSRKLPIPSSKINPYRMIILLRIVILGLFFHYRILHPVNHAYGLWLTSVICEIWFALAWILDQLPKWSPVERETYLDRLSFRYEKEGKPSELASVDIFVSTVNPVKEPPLVTANTVLSILAVDYPAEKVTCYVSDDGASMLTFEVLSETSMFARKWVPFCKKFEIEPRAPEQYFSQKLDYLVEKREYEEFKVRINGFVATAKKVPEEGWTMQDGTPWPGNNARDHPGMIHVFLGQDEDENIKVDDSPRLIYVSREKKTGLNHHSKAGAMNSLLRVSAIISNAPYILNVDYDQCMNNSKALREAMCFMMDSTSGKKICFVQFPEHIDAFDRLDTHSIRDVVFFDINMKGLDGIQGPLYIGTNCIFRRHALYGFEAPKKKKDSVKTTPKCFQKFCCCLGCGSKKIKNKKAKLDKEKNNIKDDFKQIQEKDLENSFAKKLGESHAFIATTLLEDGSVLEGYSSESLLNEAIHVISCGYEHKTEWGKEVGWIYGSVRAYTMTGFKMHCRGWRSVYCVPKTPAFKGSAPKNLSEQLRKELRSALGAIEILFSKNCPIWFGNGYPLKWLQRLSYINTVVYPITSIPLLAYCTLPAICLLMRKFIIPEISSYANILFISLFISIVVTSVLEMWWGRIGIRDWWRSEQFWVIGSVSSHFFALLQGLLKIFAGINANFAASTSEAATNEGEFSEFFVFKWTYFLITPLTLLIINIIGIIVGTSNAISNGYKSWGPFFGRLFFATWVIIHLSSVLKGFLGKKDRLPTILLAWSLLLASVFSLWWIRINPFVSKDDIDLSEDCGLDCY